MTQSQARRPNRYNAARSPEDAALRAQATRVPRVRWTGQQGRSVPLVSVLRAAGVVLAAAALYAYAGDALRAVGL